MGRLGETWVRWERRGKAGRDAERMQKRGEDGRDMGRQGEKWVGCAQVIGGLCKVCY